MDNLAGDFYAHEILYHDIFRPRYLSLSILPPIMEHGPILQLLGRRLQLSLGGLLRWSLVLDKFPLDCCERFAELLCHRLGS